ncbi:MAG: 4-alpha-glucanotransferase [Acidobacteria bacterium]|nr:4-alpha-glucanotransferase [Acidobacteriota bacterium]
MRRRTAGLLLHPTSLPGPFGIGDLGPRALDFLDWAERAGQQLWQVLPLGPTHGSGAPYGCLSAFAGNPLLLSPELLHRQGLLGTADLRSLPDFPSDRVDFQRVGPWKQRLLRRSWEIFRERGTPGQRQRLEAFRQDPEQRSWLDDWTLFAALRDAHQGAGWWTWDTELRARQPEALAEARRRLADELEFHAYLQHQFFLQWSLLREHAHSRGIRLLGDLPIYVALDSAEVWAQPHLFDLDAEGMPRAVAGVPPDYFSPTGQLWGNPLYRWDRMAEDGFSWWIRRLRANLWLTDVVRLDHFRGFAAYWSVPAGETTAIRGEWIPGPGAELFEAFLRELGELPLVAEDLGVITPDVVALRDGFGLPGMHVLQFGLTDPESIHAPHNHVRRAVVYTGTHDNDTTVGWYESLDRRERREVRRYTGSTSKTMHWALIRLAYTSVAETAVVPVQDVLGLGAEARMNTPGVADGNWGWRYEESSYEHATLSLELAARLRELAAVTGRGPRRRQQTAAETQSSELAAGAIG